MIILDFYGPGSGVGRCTIEILRELESMAVPTLLAGHFYETSRLQQCLSSPKHIRFQSLDRPRYRVAHLQVSLYRRFFRRQGCFSDVMLRLARQTGDALMPPEQRKILVNFPQVMPSPERERGFSVFIHDLNWLHYPGNFRDPALTDRWCRGWVERADRVLTNSEFTRREVIEHYLCPPEKVVAAPLAPHVETTALEPSIASRTLARLGLVSGKFFLFPNGWGVHKGYDTLTDAMELADGIDPVVVTCGSPARDNPWLTPGINRARASLVARWKQLAAQKRLIITDSLPEPEIQALRLHCKAFVLPSRFEGFGFPLVEAVYNHRPAIVSDIPAHREILDRYPRYRLAQLFPAGSVEKLAAELQRPVATSPVPDGWSESINAVWSWRQTVAKILQAIA